MSIGRPVRSAVQGTVLQFDPLVGAGTVTDGTSSWPFHCTQLRNGARAIPAGTAVEFDVHAGLPGTWEAAGVRAIPGAFLCPVCGTAVDGQEGSYEICPMCGWEDDPVQRDDAQALGANSRSLSDARNEVIRALIFTNTGEAQPEARG